MADLKSGRLTTDGTGKLYIMPVDENGEVASSIHLVDEDGVATDELVPMTEVRWDADAGGYVEVTDGTSHNETHEENVLDISGTTGPLYDGEGNLVYEGDPHHFEPLPDDAHYDENAPNNTKTDTIPDEIAATATSHTEAFTS